MNGSILDRRVRLPAASRVLAALWVLLSMCAGTPAQESQEPRDRAKDGPTPLVTFGWGGRIPADRWGPVTIDISDVSKPIGGYVVLEYAQDETQHAQVRVPFAATPDVPTRVQAVAAMPVSALGARVSLIDERGRTLRTVNYGTGSMLALPGTFDPESEPLVIGVGRVGATDALTQWARALEASAAESGDGGPRRTSGNARWTRAHTARCEVADMPVSAMAYDAATALIVSADAAADADPRALGAVREWVRAGGRLVIVAGTPGDHWRMWFPQDAALPISIEAPRAGAVPPAVIAAQSGFERLLRTRAQEFSEVGGRAEPLPAPADSAPVRPITLTPAGADASWMLRWPQQEGEAALLAEGPMGLGWIIVLGIDPAKTSSVLSARAAGAVWRDALNTVGEQLVSTGSETTAWGWGMRDPGLAASAINSGIERVGNVPVIGDLVFALIAACIFVLAILVGPLDFFLLRRMRMAHRSWVTALVWTVLAGIGAYTLPRVIRTDPTQFNRITVADSVAQGRDERSGAFRFGPAHYTAISGIYTAQSGTAEFRDVVPTSWWRGVSPQYYYGASGPKGAGVLPVLQAAAGGEAGSVRGSPVSHVPLPLWTFRTMLDQGETSVPLLVRMGKSGTSPQVTLVGLPEMAVVSSAVLRTSKGWHTLRHTPGDGSHTAPIPEGIFAVGVHEQGTWKGTFARAGLLNPPGDWTYHRGGFEHHAQQGQLQLLPGSLARTATIDYLIDSGGWACVYLMVENWPAAPTLSWDARYGHARMLRLLVPAEQDERSAAEEEDPT